jgi:hypothetical protein
VGLSAKLGLGVEEELGELLVIFELVAQLVETGGTQVRHVVQASELVIPLP